MLKQNRENKPDPNQKLYTVINKKNNFLFFSLIQLLRMYFINNLSVSCIKHLTQINKTKKTSKFFLFITL